MMMKWMIAALALAGTGAFSQTALPAVRVKKSAAPAASPQTTGALKLLRAEVKRDKNDIAAKVKSERAERKQLVEQEKAEIAKVRSAAGNRADKKKTRVAVRAKYARFLQDARQKSLFERKQLREDMASKSGQIKKLRSS